MHSQDGPYLGLLPMHDKLAAKEGCGHTQPQQADGEALHFGQAHRTMFAARTCWRSRLGKTSALQYLIKQNKCPASGTTGWSMDATLLLLPHNLAALVRHALDSRGLMSAAGATEGPFLSGIDLTLAGRCAHHPSHHRTSPFWHLSPSTGLGNWCAPLTANCRDNTLFTGIPVQSSCSATAMACGH